MEKKPIPYLIGKGLTYVSLALFAVFTALKFAHVIRWSWWIVCTPFCIPLAFCIVICGLAMYLISIKVPTDES